MTLREEFAITVDDDDRVIHHHTQDHDQRSQGHGVQLHAHKVHHTERDRNTNRQTGRADQSRTHREEDEHDGYHNEDGDHEVFEERPHTLIYHTRLIGDLMHPDVRRQRSAHMLQHLIHFGAKGNDVIVRLHLDIHQQAVTCSVLVKTTDILRRFGVPTSDGGDVFQTDRLTGNRIGHNDLLA